MIDEAFDETFPIFNMKDAGYFHVPIVSMVAVHQGWGVGFTPKWEQEGNEKWIEDITPHLFKIAPETVIDVNGQAYVPSVDGKVRYPATAFYNYGKLRDKRTHDLRNRWFETEHEARAHMDRIVAAFNDPDGPEEYVTFE
jgi:hypothetical protein